MNGNFSRQLQVFNLMEKIKVYKLMPLKYIAATSV